MNVISTLAVTGLLLAPTTPSVQSLQLHSSTSSPSIVFNQAKPQTIHVPNKNETKQTPSPAETPRTRTPDPVIHSVVEGDTLTSIGTLHNVEWQRIWSKNTQLQHPDQINVGDKLTIPLADEILNREIPPSVTLPTVTPGVAPTIAQNAPNVPQRASGGDFGGGNTYDYGYCTWYVKNRRGSSIPNMLGNANTWYARAQSMGMAVGSVPQAGAVGTTTRGAYGHVVYVESVNGDGTINISEMNAPRWGVTTSRVASASEFVYIY